jgi:exoribonuclease R
MEEILLFRKEKVKIDFPPQALEEAEHILMGSIEIKIGKNLIPTYMTELLEYAYFKDPKKTFPIVKYETTHESTIRTDFRNWYTLTIDGADAKDLDDAISIARYSDG